MRASGTSIRSPPLPGALLAWEGRAAGHATWPTHGRPLHVAAWRLPPLPALLWAWPAGAPLLRRAAVPARPTKLGALRREAALSRRPAILRLLLLWAAIVSVHWRTLCGHGWLPLRQRRLVVALPSRHGRRHLLLLHLRRRRQRLLLLARRRGRRLLLLLRLRRVRAALPEAKHGVHVAVRLQNEKEGRSGCYQREQGDG